MRGGHSRRLRTGAPLLMLRRLRDWEQLLSDVSAAEREGLMRHVGALLSADTFRRRA